MLQTCLSSSIKIFESNDEIKQLSKELSCPELVARVLKMLHEDSNIEELRECIRPDFRKQLESLNLGEGAKAAKDLWESKSSFGNVLVYGDYDVDGISSTVLAMEIFRNKAAQVRYFIPRRDIHGYGLNSEILDKVVSWGCNTLVVVDCGTNDSEMLEKLKNSGINIFVFDHHTVSSPITIKTIVNPSINMDAGEQQKICATAVLWCWACKEKIISQNFLKYSVDLVALATIADCMPLHNLNRLLVRYGINLMKTNPRRGLAALFNCLSINKEQISEEFLSMKVIPCLNAPGRIAVADVGVRALLGAGSNESVYSCVNELTRINNKRKSLTEEITRKIDTGITSGKIDQKVLYNDSWPIGVLSGVASRVCAEYKRPIALAAPTNGGKIIRGTLRVPEGGDAVGILKEISEKLDAWGGHVYAAGFSVLMENWQDVKNDLENALTDIKITNDEKTPVINISPSDVSILDWRMISELGPFGNNNPAPKLFTHADVNSMEIAPLGKDNKHSNIKIKNSELLAFNISPKELLEISEKIQGFIYHPKLNYWNRKELLQFSCDYVVIKED